MISGLLIAVFSVACGLIVGYMIGKTRADEQYEAYERERLIIAEYRARSKGSAEPYFRER